MLTSRSTIHRVADLGDDPRAGFEATTYPLALLASRRHPPPGHAVRLGLDACAARQPQSLWRETAPWLTASPAIQRVAARLAREHATLGDQLRPQLGVKTGANVAFLDPPDELREWCRPAIRGRDVRPFRASTASRLLWPADARGVAWTCLPTLVARYLEEHRTRLQRRADQHRGPWWQLFRTHAATAAHRVVWRDLAVELQAAVAGDPLAVPLNSCYVLAVASAPIAEALAAWLNAGPIRALARLSAEPAAGGCARFAARTIGSLPLPGSVPGNPILAAFTHAAIDHDVQAALDDCVAGLLELTTAERDLLLALAQNRR